MMIVSIFKSIKSLCLEQHHGKLVGSAFFKKRTYWEISIIIINRLEIFYIHKTRQKTLPKQEKKTLAKFQQQFSLILVSKVMITGVIFVLSSYTFS